MANRETGTSLDSAFEAMVRTTAVLDSVLLKQRYDACIKEGGDPLTCWLQQPTGDGLLVSAPPPEFPEETGVPQALALMRASTEEL